MSQWTLANYHFCYSLHIERFGGWDSRVHASRRNTFNRYFHVGFCHGIGFHQRINTTSAYPYQKPIKCERVCVHGCVRAWEWNVVTLHLTATYSSLQTSWNAYASRAKANARSMKNEKKIAALHYILSSVDGVARRRRGTRVPSRAFHEMQQRHKIQLRGQAPALS